MPSGAEEIPAKTEGHIRTSLRRGLGNGFLLPSPPDGMSLPDDIRRAMNYISRFDIEYGSNFAITFDPEFCEQIDGYPEGACLWYKHDGDHYDLVISKIGDNKYNFLEHPEYIDGEKWDWAVPQATNSSGYPYIKQEPIRPFGTNVAVGKKDGSSIISDIYQAESDGFLYALASIDYDFDESYKIPSLTNCPYFANGRMNGTIAFNSMQAYVAISSEGSEHNWYRNIYPTVNVDVPQIDIPPSGTKSQTIFFGNYISISSSPQPMKIKYYPLFTGSLGQRAVFVPVRKGQFVFLAMSSFSRYNIKKLNVDLRIYNFASFDGEPTT